MSDANTIFLRLEGPLQAWADNSKMLMRRTKEAPTKSAVLGLICCAKGLSRKEAQEHLPELNALVMGVRIDRAGTRRLDYHTVGAGYGILSAKGEIKKTASTKEYETLISRREYLCDASFIVALQGAPEAIRKIADALSRPKWPPYLGRKSCPPSAPILVTRKSIDGKNEPDVGSFDNVEQALISRRMHPRTKKELPRDWRGNLLKKVNLECLIEWRAISEDDVAPVEAEVWYDKPVFFNPPVHEARLVQRKWLEVPVGAAILNSTPSPSRLRADYGDSAYRKARACRLDADKNLCVFCKAPATTVQHVTYRRAGGNEDQKDLRSLCRLCHDAVTMIEYGLGMGLDRIDPCEPHWRKAIIKKRNEIVEFRSLETRRRRLSPEEVE